MSKEQSIVAYEDAKTKTIRYEVNGVDITNSVEILKEQFLNQWNKEHRITTELSFYERNNYAKQISDLEAKLATQENTITNLVEDNRASQEWYKKQLTEKDEQIKELTECNQYLQIYRNQDKISFAVEQLTEIREYVKNCWSLDETEGKVRLDIAKKIRLKIEKLKESK